MKSLLATLFLFAMTACVTKARYANIQQSIHSKEKQQTRLLNQQSEVRAKNALLRDSINKLRG